MLCVLYRYNERFDLKIENTVKKITLLRVLNMVKYLQKNNINICICIIYYVCLIIYI